MDQVGQLCSVWDRVNVTLAKLTGLLVELLQEFGSLAKQELVDAHALFKELLKMFGRLSILGVVTDQLLER